MDHPRNVTPALTWPTPEEDEAITRAALGDPDTWLPTDAELANARPVWDNPELVAFLQKEGKLGRPPLPATHKKQRVTLHLDPDVLARLREGGKGWQTRANAALRKALGL